MAAYTLALDLVRDVEELASRTVALHDEFADTFRAATHTPLQVRSLRASFSGVLVEIRAIRDRMDETQTADLAVNPNDEAVIINFARWERDQRSLLSRLTVLSLRVVSILVSLEQGPERRIITSKSGETLQTIALRELGSHDDWQVLLAANPDLTPGPLASGTVIIIPEKR